MECSCCIYWKRSESKQPWEKIYGSCRGLFDYDNVEIFLKTGWSGGYVSKIETKESFYCANFREEEKDGTQDY